ncbi:MAG TPA: hypothetical protein VHB21_25065 [Minicystis sp.]|nr:hypothetical protein [Minicystis sp.]
MKIQRLASWVFPSFFGTLVSSWAYVTLATLFGFTWPFPSKILSWLVLMAIATPVAAALVAATLAFDVVLLAVKARALPQGRAAWRMAAVTPLLVGASYVFFRPSLLGGVAGLFMTLVAPVLLSALGVRLVMGEKVQKHQRS